MMKRIRSTFWQNFKHCCDAKQRNSADVRSGPKVIKLFLCSTQLSMKFSPLIHVKMPTTVGILTCMSGKNSNLGLSEPKKC